MNVEEYHEIVAAMARDIEATRLPAHVSAVVTGLNELGQPNLNPQQLANAQRTVTDAATAISAAASSAPSNEFTPRWMSMICDLKVDHLLAGPVAEVVEGVLARNQITPQIAADELSELNAELEAFKAQLQAARESLEFFSVPTTELEPGEFDIAVRIPRTSVDDSLKALGVEFEEISEILLPFVELGTGSREPLTVKTIASSEFETIVEVAPHVAVLVSGAIDTLLQNYERIRKVREMISELRSNGISDDTTAEVAKEAVDNIEKVIPEIAKAAVEAATELNGQGREFEIETEVTRSVRRLASKVDHGFRFTVRAGPAIEEHVEADEDSELVDGPTPEAIHAEHLRSQVTERQQRADYHELPGTPILELDAASDPSED